MPKQKPEYMKLGYILVGVFIAIAGMIGYDILTSHPILKASGFRNTITFVYGNESLTRDIPFEIYNEGKQGVNVRGIQILSDKRNLSAIIECLSANFTHIPVYLEKEARNRELVCYRIPVAKNGTEEQIRAKFYTEDKGVFESDVIFIIRWLYDKNLQNIVIATLYECPSKENCLTFWVG